ncbi:helix-turn-helix transcriptional regulator [Salinirubellus sp. GCM10025818]|uniref:helix-turn-helix transcriptional regulator n=1 Tax=Salinirubellus TaxID=2162630 RepID=UPI0030D0B3D5
MDNEVRAGERADDQPAARADAPTSWTDLLDQPEVSKRDVRVEFGLQPDEFLAQLVRSADGRMWQADLVETTGWSKSTVSRYLDGLETDGTVERIWIGRQKLVSLPEAAPETPDATDGPSVGSTTGSWASESDRLT